MFDASSLNERQLEAASYGPGNLLVLAGPGSGKTYTTLQRIFFLIERQKVRPEKILVITFTKDAALNMQNRFISLESFPQPVCFGTFHSVFFHIIQDYFPQKKLNIVSNKDKKRIISKIVSCYFSDKNEIAEFTDHFISSMSFYKNTNDINITAKHCNPFDRELFCKILDLYENYRKKNYLVDFDDMVRDCLDILSKDEKFRKKWQDRFSHILIDEFQDINQVQYDTVKMLTGNNTFLFVVGDDDQSIYGFRGSNPDFLKQYISHFNAGIINLNLNYRNPEGIITASSKVINENKDRIYKDSISNMKSKNNSVPDKVIGFSQNSNSDNVIIKGFTTALEEYEKLCEEMESANGKMIACLFRTNLGLQNFAVFLNKKGIRFSLKENIQSVYEHFVVKDLLAYFNFAHDRNDLKSALMIANKPCRGTDIELLAEGRDLETLIKIPAKELDFIKNNSMFLSLNYILGKIGYKKYLTEKYYGSRDKLNECFEIIEWLKNDMRGYDCFDEYMLHVKEYEKELKNDVSKVKTNVFLMTMHGAKGLEFPYVFIPDCNEGNYPHGKMPDEDTVSEERRLFYVGMTRASEKLFLYFIKGTKERIAIPSRFLNKLLSS